MFRTVTPKLRTIGFFGEVAADVLDQLGTIAVTSVLGSAAITAYLSMKGLV